MVMSNCLLNILFILEYLSCSQSWFRENSFYSGDCLIQRLITGLFRIGDCECSAIKKKFSTSTSPNPRLREHHRCGQKEYKSQRTVKCYLLGMTWLMNKSTHSSHDCLYEINPVNIPAWIKEELQIPNP